MNNRIDTYTLYKDLDLKPKHDYGPDYNWKISLNQTLVLPGNFLRQFNTK